MGFNVRNLLLEILLLDLLPLDPRVEPNDSREHIRRAALLSHGACDFARLELLDAPAKVLDFGLNVLGGLFDTLGPFLVRLEKFEALSVEFEFNGLLFAEVLDGLQRLCVLGRRENLVKLLFENAGLRERPRKRAFASANLRKASVVNKDTNQFDSS